MPSEYTGASLCGLAFSFFEGKLEPEGASFSYGALYVELGFVEAKDLLHDGETQTAAFRGTDMMGA